MGTSLRGYNINASVLINQKFIECHVAVFQSPSHVWCFVTPGAVACQASLSLIISQSLPSLYPLYWWCHPAISSSDTLFSFCPQSFPASGTFSNVSAVHIRWPKYWSFSFSISPSKCSRLISLKSNWFDVLAVQGTLRSLLQHHSLKASI